MKKKHSDRATMTPLKAIGGHSIQSIRNDCVQNFCACNGIRGCRNAAKTALCWAICMAREVYLAGEPPPYRGLVPTDREQMADLSQRWKTLQQQREGVQPTNVAQGLDVVQGLEEDVDSHGVILTGTDLCDKGLEDW